MIRRTLRALWPLALLLAVFSWRAVGCKKEPKVETPEDRRSTYRKTALLRATLRGTPSPTMKLPPGVTRYPDPPE